jgi:nitrogen fixation/metabolism regulation signal transduction histidine kinase
MTRKHKVRGIGFKFALPFVLRYSIMWFIVIVAAVPLFGMASYLMSADLLTDEARSRLWTIVLTLSPLVIVAVAALALFTTQRLAGPFVALKRALDDVKNGDLDRRLQFRRADGHVRDIETAFNDMMAALRARMKREGSG